MQERQRTRTILAVATLIGAVILVPLVGLANRAPDLVAQGTANRLDLWVIMMAWIVGPFGIPVGLLAAWFMYANEQYRQAIGWLVLPLAWGLFCLGAALAAAHFGPWLLG